ncbi:MAG TPA: hypothetical protein VEL07_03790 [Planctomycetota bacterium]|nr:hypothetical protein [Planctomycetota bacterium]
MLLRCALLVALACATPLAAMSEHNLDDEVTKTFIIHNAIEVPADLEGRTVGLFVCFHGRGGKAPDSAHTVLESLRRLGLDQEYVVIGAKANAEGWEEANDFVNVTKLIAWATRTYPINPRRRYTFGFSSGGWMSGSYAITHPELIAASIIHGAGIGLDKVLPAKDPEHLLLDFYTIAGHKDPDHLESARRGCAKLEQCGYRSILREVEDLAHSTDCPPQNDDAIRWAHSHRHKVAPLPAYDADALKPLRKPGAVKDASAAPDVFASLVRVGGAHAGATIAPFLDTKDPAVRALAAQAHVDASFGVDAVPTIGRKLKDKDGGVRAAAIAALRVAANWRYRAAQDALAQIATDRGWDIAERRLAAEGLAFAVRLQVRGRYEDPGMFRALVKLLDDDDLDLRTIAFTAIRACIPSDYDPSVAAKADRRTMLGKWHEWLATLETPAVAGRKAGT